MFENDYEKILLAMTTLGQSIAKWMMQDAQSSSKITAIPALSLVRHDKPTQPITNIYQPSICLIAQGEKRVALGESVYFYDIHHYLLTAIHLPTTVQVTQASHSQPYLGLKLQLDLHEVAQLMTEAHLPPANPQSIRGMAIGKITPALVDAFQRLVNLLDNQQDIPMLAPMIQREIIYRLLVSEQGDRLRQIVASGSQSHAIAKVIVWLNAHFTQSLRIDDLAEQANMSTSTFHHHFRAMTALSPLQYQKQLRLQEARRLMLAEHLDVASAAFQVGYESPSQFSREYGRLFGAPPLRDITQLREQVTS